MADNCNKMVDNCNKIVDDNILNISYEIIKSLFESIEKFLNEIKLKNIISGVFNFIIIIFYVINGINYIIGIILFQIGILFLILSSIISEYLNFDKQIKNSTSNEVIENSINKIEKYIQPLIIFCRKKYDESVILAKNLNQSDKSNDINKKS